MSNGWLEKFKKRNELIFKKNRGDFDTCDDGVMTAGTLSDDEIIDSLAQKTDTNDLDDIEDSYNTTSAPSVSIKEARTALNILRIFIEQTSNSDEQEFSYLRYCYR